MHANYGDDSPIAAFATTPGNSALTLIRCSGKGVIDLASCVFSADIKNVQGNTVVHSWIINTEENHDKKIDEVLVSVFRAPKSYTGEDSLDICCHGGLSAGKAVMAVLQNSGFRDALPGEFTFRAFMNGKLDLTRCESVMELVSAKTEKGRSHAVSRLCGSLEKEINDIKNLLVQVLAGAEIYLDYSEDEISAEFDASASEEIAGRIPNKDIAVNVLERLKKLSESWQLERVYQEGITVVIAGRPNAGKSSLFNALLKEDRSIVTEVPGTTRDWIEVLVSMDGIPVRLIDTAGLRNTADSVEQIGVKRSRKLMQEAHLVLYVIDGAQGLTEEDNKIITQSNGKNIFIWNKADIKPASKEFIGVSARNGDGLTELNAAIIMAIQKMTTLLSGDSCGASLGTLRQKNLVDVACSALEEALALEEHNEPLDLIAPLIREAVNALGEITGEVSTADILDEMFSRFCVGK